MRKLQQLYRLVRESHQTPLTGVPQKPLLVSPQSLGLTFIGHSSFLVQIGGRNLLIDPVFANRLILLRRQRRPGVSIADLPPIDAVLLTHAHMDHLNLPSLRRIVRHTRRLGGRSPIAIVPRGVSDLVSSLGFKEVVALDWWESTQIAPDRDSKGTAHVEITMTPSKHWGARMFSDTHRGFGGYVVAAGEHRVYHSGDTAYFRGFKEIGERLRPTIALLPIGAYYPDSYRAVHTSPEEALQAFLDLGTAAWMAPMHYGTFRLGREPMEEPLPRLAAAADRAGVGDRIRQLAEGETFVAGSLAEARQQEHPSRHGFAALHRR